jgi:hypothetical protein
VTLRFVYLNTRLLARSQLASEKSRDRQLNQSFPWFYSIRRENIDFVIKFRVAFHTFSLCSKQWSLPNPLCSSFPEALPFSQKYAYKKDERVLPGNLFSLSIPVAPTSEHRVSVKRFVLFQFILDSR